MNTYFELAIYTWDYDWEDVEFEYFKTKDAAEAEKQEIANHYNGKMNVKFNIEEISFNDMKSRITVSDFEELFNIVISEP